MSGTSLLARKTRHDELSPVRQRQSPCEHDTEGARPAWSIVGTDQRPLLSVVVPVYGNQDTIEPLYERIARVLDANRLTWRLIFVNDASPDRSIAILRRLAREDQRVDVVDLPLNVGQPRAVLEGLKRATGRYVAVLDADLQDPPEAIPLLLRALDSAGSQTHAVFAGHRGRYEAWSRWVTGKLFRAFRGWLCSIPRDAGSFGIMRSEVIPVLLRFDVPSPHWPVLLGCAGFRSRSVPVQRHARPCGQSAYTLGKRLRLAVDLVRTALLIKTARRPDLACAMTCHQSGGAFSPSALRKRHGRDRVA